MDETLLTKYVLIKIFVGKNKSNLLRVKYGSPPLQSDKIDLVGPTFFPKDLFWFNGATSRFGFTEKK